MDIAEKLDILARDAQYDLSCACSTKRPEEHRKRSKTGSWLYPVTVASGGSGIMLKTLLSNSCANDCKYCPLRTDSDTQRITLQPDHLARYFMDLLTKRKLIGLFLSSGVIGTPDFTMDRLIATADLLRNRYRYRGYIHIKIIPGASTAAIDRVLSLASAVSLNIETPGSAHFEKLSTLKHYETGIMSGLTYLSEQTAKGSPHARITKTSQFIVGASDETDQEILKYTWGMYRRLGYDRLYYSAYQQGLGDSSIPGEQRAYTSLEENRQLCFPTFSIPPENSAPLLREHRLYQADFLFRSYGFSFQELLFDQSGNLDLRMDPKMLWAQNHPEFFPVSLSKGTKEQLLRVPGIGPILAHKIIDHRKKHPLGSLDTVCSKHYFLEKARPFVQH